MSKIKDNKIVNSLILGMLLLLILALGLTIALVPNTAAAETPGYYKGYSNKFVDTSYDADDDYVDEDDSVKSPKLYYVDPNYVEARRESMRITVSGANFTPDSVVRFDGGARTTRFDNDGKLTATLTSTDMTSLGVHTVTVSTPRAGTSNIKYLTVERGSGSVAGASTNKNPNTYVTNPSDDTVDEPIVYNDYRGEFSDLTANTIFGSGSFFPSSVMQWILAAILILIIVIIARKFFGGEDHYHATPLKHH